MNSEAVSPQRLMVKLALYFLLLFGSLVAAAVLRPELLTLLPFGGTDAIEVSEIGSTEDLIERRDESTLKEQGATRQPPTVSQIGLVAAYLGFSLAGTILVMLPITWTFTATKRDIGYSKNFVRALIVLPICATTIVLLIQDSLALAFGLAAMVAAVRFRVALAEAIDGIYIFSSICVGLAAGIGYLGIAMVMAMVFCFSNAVLWQMDYGQNPIEDAKLEKKREKLENPKPSTG